MGPRRCFVATVALLAVFNVVRALGVFGARADVAALGLTLALAAIARAARLDAPTLGLARADLRRGAAYGAGVFALVAVVVGAAAVIPATSGFLEDSRADVSAGGLAWQVLVATLLVTVIPEELAFRGILLGTGLAAWRPRTAVLASSGVFGLWHIAPTLSTMDGNEQAADASQTVAGQVSLVTGSVAVTFVAGLVFCWLRLRSRSLLAPVLAHLATNSVAFTAAWVVVHRG